MPSLAEVWRQLWGAWRLARGDPDGIKVFGNDVRAFWQSFAAAGIVLPLYLAMIGLRPDMVGVGSAGIDTARFWLAELATYANAWVVFPFLMLPLARWIDRENRYIRYICAYNWASVLQSSLQLFIILLAAGGLVPAGGAQLLGLLVFVAVMLYGWFIAKTALDIPALNAVGIVAVDFLTSTVVQVVGEGLKYG